MLTYIGIYLALVLALTISFCGRIYKQDGALYVGTILVMFTIACIPVFNVMLWWHNFEEPEKATWFDKFLDWKVL